MKLSENQKQVIRIMRQYPNDSIMNLTNRYVLTGGHGVQFDGRIVNGLKYRKQNHIIGTDWKLTELGKSINID